MLAYKYNSEVLENGVIKLPQLNLTKGTKVEVIIIVPTEHKTEDFSDLLHAAESSMDFWDNDIDDEVWNRV
jgi:predicted DNA-binding antitoxin AbrB/MazE fold protein